MFIDIWANYCHTVCNHLCFWYQFFNHMLFHHIATDHALQSPLLSSFLLPLNWTELNWKLTLLTHYQTAMTTGSQLTAPTASGQFLHYTHLLNAATELNWTQLSWGFAPTVLCMLHVLEWPHLPVWLLEQSTRERVLICQSNERQVAGQMLLPQLTLCSALMARSMCSIYAVKCNLQISKQTST
jgi:hypothetical protein